MKKIFLWQLIKSTPLSAWRYAVTRVRLYALLLRDPATPLHVKGLMVVAAAYLLSPADFTPDYVPILGLMDDFAILGVILSYTDRYITDEMRARINDIDM